MSDDLIWAIATIPNHVTLLFDLAPSTDWINHPLFERWVDWRTRQMLTNEEYLSLHDYLKRCLDRAITLKLEASYAAQKNQTP